MDNLEAFRRSVERSYRKNDANQKINLVAGNLERAKSELSVTAIATFNTVKSVDNELQNRSTRQNSVQ